MRWEQWAQVMACDVMHVQERQQGMNVGDNVMLCLCESVSCGVVHGVASWPLLTQLQTGREAWVEGGKTNREARRNVKESCSHQ